MEQKLLASAILLGIALSGCGAGVGGRARATAATTTVTNTSNFAIAAFSPAEGNVASLPTTVLIAFNQNYLSANANNASYYNLSCGGNVFQAAAVQYAAGSNYVTVTLPAVGAVSTGTACYFSVSPNVTNTDGYSPVGTRSAAYYVTNNQSVAAGSTTAAVGGTGGTGFSETAGSTLELMSGLRVRAATYVAAVQGEWQENFRSGGTIVTGSLHGDGSAGSETSFSCPSGMRITGLRGRAGTYVNAVGIVCKDSTQATFWESSLAGGAGGGSFAVNCPAGTFASGLAGRSGGYVDQLALICQ